MDILDKDEVFPNFSSELKSLKKAKLDFEKHYIIRSLVMNDWNVINAAKTLQIDRTNLYKKIQFHNISLDK